MDGWIDITEFADKYGVSASTLRRRIRNNSIAFKMHRGKYLLEDSTEALKAAPLFSRRHAMHAAPQQSMRSTQMTDDLHDPVDAFMNSSQVLPLHLKEEHDKVLSENKRLKAQIEELETLVKMLESELSTSTSHSL